MIPTHDAVVVLCTVPDDALGAALAKALVERKLAACVARLGPIRSTYAWNGEVKEDSEIQLVIKTHRDRLDDLERYVRAHHPYEVPELLALPAAAGSHAYLSFIDEGTRPG